MTRKFLSAGAATALALQSDGLSVFENGIGSLNLPYLRSQQGAQATRSMHPRTLNLMVELVCAITGRAFQIVAPYRGLTKAELLSGVSSDADEILARTVSCDTGFAARVKNRRPCGKCTSCLLRRQAVLASGRTFLDDVASYRDQTMEGVALSAMLWQVLRLRECLSAQQPWAYLVDGFPELMYAQAYMKPGEIIRLYRRYVQEWDSLMETFPISRAWVYGKDGG